MARYLVTGGCGFIGSHLCRALLKQGNSVIVVDNLSNKVAKEYLPDTEIVSADVLDEQQLSKAFTNVDGCFHLAAAPSVQVSIDDWLKLHNINLDATIAVFQQAIKQNNVPVVYASSCAVYGDCQDLPLKETAEVTPISAYGVDKLSCEFNAKFASQQFSLPTFGLRIFNTYGPGQNANSIYSGVITKFIERIKQKKPVTIFGDGRQTRDFVYIDDTVNTLLRAMDLVKMHPGEVINVARNTPISINDLVKLLADQSNQKIQINYQPARSYDVTHSAGSTEKATSLGVPCNTDIKTGLNHFALD